MTMKWIIHNKADDSPSWGEGKDLVPLQIPFDNPNNSHNIVMFFHAAVHVIFSCQT